MKAPSRSGLSDPAAKGMIVRGVTATETALHIVNQDCPCHVSLPRYADFAPFEAPVVGAVGWIGRRDGGGIVDTPVHDLREGRKNLARGAGLERCSRDGLEHWLAALDSEGRQCGGGEAALSGRSQRLAKQGRAEYRGHGGEMFE